VVFDWGRKEDDNRRHDRVDRTRVHRVHHQSLSPSNKKEDSPLKRDLSRNRKAQKFLGDLAHSTKIVL